MLGADICYSIKALPFIFQCIKILLAHREGSRGYLGYVSRLLSRTYLPDTLVHSIYMLLILRIILLSQTCFPHIFEEIERGHYGSPCV